MSRARRLVELWERDPLAKHEVVNQCSALINEEGVDAVLGALPEELLDALVNQMLDCFFGMEAGLQYYSVFGSMERDPYGLTGSHGTYTYDRYLIPEAIAVRGWVERNWDSRRVLALKRESAIVGVKQVPPVAQAVVPALLDALEDPIPRVRRQALEALAALDPAPIDVARKLIRLFLEAEDHPGIDCFPAHLDKSAEPLVPDLEELLGKRPGLHKEIAAALGQIGTASDSAVDRLLAFARKKGPYPAAPILAAIGRILGSRADRHEEFLALVRNTLEGPLRYFLLKSRRAGSTDRVLSITLPLLHELPEAVVAKAFPDCDRTAILQEFVKAIGPNAIRGFAGLGPVPIPYLVQRMLSSQRYDAAEELGKLGDRARPAIVVLLQALNDQSQGVRTAAAKALWRIGVGREHGNIVAQFARDYNRTLRAWACLIVGNSGLSFPEVAEVLIERLCDDYPAVRIAAALAIRRFGQAALPGGSEPVDRFIRETFLVYPSEEDKGKSPRIRDDAHLPLLEAFQKHPDPRVRGLRVTPLW